MPCLFCWRLQTPSLYPKGGSENLIACLSIINRLKEAAMDPLAFVLEVSVSIVRKSHDLTITRPEFFKLMLSIWALYIDGRTLVYSYLQLDGGET